MKIIIRTDAAVSIGTGHVMRCLTLAEELKTNHHEVYFICYELIGHMCDFIEEKGFHVFRIPTNDPLDLEQLRSVSNIIPIIKALDVIEWLIIDHYFIDGNEEIRLREYVGNIMVIDDLANRSHDCDLLLNQNLYEGYEHKYDDLIPKNCIKLLGPQFTLLRKEFQTARTNFQLKNGFKNQLLVCFGGTDPTNETLKALKAIEKIAEQDYDVIVVVGTHNPNLGQIKLKCEVMDNVELHIQVSNMSELMAKSDLAICSGGTLTWERFCMGLPALTIAIADNQIEVASYAGKLNIDNYLGISSLVSVDEINKALVQIALNRDWLSRSSRKALKLVDGLGTERVSAYIC